MAFPSITRRTALAGASALGAATIWRPRDALATKQLTVVLESEVIDLRSAFHHGGDHPHLRLSHLVDTLFSMDEQGRDPTRRWWRPTRASPDKLTWTFTLRDGLKWHDGSAGHRRRMRGLDQPLVGARRRWARC